jgi:hypothetical protein
MLAHPKRINPTVYGVNRSAVERLAAYSTNLLKVWLKNWSNPPRKKAKTIDRAITTAVSLTVSSRLGQTDFRSSDRVSCRNSTGLTLLEVLDGIGRLSRAETLAMTAT